MSASIALSVFATIIFIPSVHTQMAVATSSGVCLAGCNISSSRIDEYEGRLKAHEKEPPTTKSAENRQMFSEYFVYPPGIHFEYCINMHNEYVRCSSRSQMTSTVFEWEYYKGFFKGFIVAERLPCSSRGCEPDNTNLLCSVNRDMFKGRHPCSILFDHVGFTAEHYLLSEHGLLLGELNTTHCVSIQKSMRAWTTVPCRQIPPSGEMISYSDECDSDGCNAQSDGLKCRRSGSSTLVPCYIKLTKVDPSDVQDNTCENWLDIHNRGTTLLNQGSSQINQAPNNYCVQHGILVMEDEIHISNIRLATSNFTCNSQETVRYIILMAKETLFIDEDISVTGAVGRRFSSLILIAKLIQATGQITINVAGSNSMEGVGDWANGTNGGNFMAAALQWQDAHLLTIDASGGDSGCRIRTKYLEQRVTWSNPGGENYVSLQLEDPRPFKFEFSRDISPQFDHTSNEFKVYGVLGYEPAKAGDFGIITVHGTEAENPTEIANQGTQKPCAGSVPFKQNCVKINYHGINEFRENFVWHSKPFLAPVPTHDSSESFFHPVRQWIVNLGDTWTDEEILKISTHIDEAQSNLQLDSPTIFYEELKILILNSKIVNNDLEIQLLHSLRRRVAEYRAATNDEINFLNWVYAAALAHNRRVRGQDKLVTNLPMFLADRENRVGEYVKSWMQTEKLRNIKSRAKNYTSEIDREVQKANDLIKTQVNPKIDEIRHNLAGELNKVVAEVKRFLQQAREHLEELNTNLKKAIASTALTGFFNAMKIVGGVVSMISPPLGTMIGAAIGGVGDVGKAVTKAALKPTNLKDIPRQIPDGTWSSIKPTSDWIDKKQARLIKNLENIITMFMSNPGIADFILLVQTNLDELRAADPSSTTRKITKRQQFAKVEQVESTISNAIQALQSSGANRADHNIHKRQEPEPETPDLSDGIMATFTASADAITDLSEGLDEIENIRGEISETEATIRNLVKFSQDFHETIMPMVLGMMDTFDLVTKELNQTSLAGVDVASWNIQSSIKDMAKTLLEVLGMFEASNEIQNSMLELQEAVGVIATVFKSIATAKDQIKFAEMLTEVTALSVTDTRLDNLVKHMKKGMVEAVIFLEVDRAISAYRQWAFPVAKEYLDVLESPPFMIEGPDLSFNDTAFDVLTEMKAIVEAENFETTLQSSLSSTLEFYLDPSTASYPFFTWEYNSHSSLIIQLLEANGPVIFFADVNLETSPHYETGAIKFQTINFEFRVVNNKTKNDILQAELERCRLNATHMGYSYYRFEGKTYLFKSKPLTFHNSTKETAMNNRNYARGTPSLSPYGYWQIQIMPRERKHVVDLQPSPEDIIHLDMVGVGIYYSNPESIDLEVDKYYKENEYP